jgi:hypothetical protein
MMQLTDYCSVNDLKENGSMKMIKKVYNTVFAPATSIDLARIELEKSKKAFLEAKTHTEFYAAQVEFESIRIKRLEEYVNVIVEAGELANNPLRQPVTPTVISPVEKVSVTNTTVAKKVAVAKKVIHSVAKKRAK